MPFDLQAGMAAVLKLPEDKGGFIDTEYGKLVDGTRFMCVYIRKGDLQGHKEWAEGSFEGFHGLFTMPRAWFGPDDTHASFGKVLCTYGDEPEKRERRWLLVFEPRGRGTTTPQPLKFVTEDVAIDAFKRNSAGYRCTLYVTAECEKD